MNPKKITEIFVPADIPKDKIEIYKKNYLALTRNTERFLLFSCDQKIEHLNEDFYGKGIPSEDNDPRHLFKIASKGNIGAMATQLGLIARYGKEYPDINYIVKLNAKTPFIPADYADPLSKNLWTVEQVVQFAERTKFNIRGIGFTLYLGSQFEAEMMTQAAQAIYHAHQHGLITILWMYPRGECVPEERAGNIVAGAAGVANALGSDFAKVNPPDETDDKTSEDWLAIAQEAAGNTKLLCSGGPAIQSKKFLKQLHEQLHKGTVSGAAIGRNIHQKTLSDAVAFTKALTALIYENKTVTDAEKLLKK